MSDMSHSVFSTCDFCDAYRDALPSGFAVLPPVFHNFGNAAPFCGSIVTVQCFEDNTSVRAQLEQPGNARVLVVAGAGSLRTALLGGNLGQLAVRHGWAGVVVDGCVRDVAELNATGVGIRALGLMPLPTEKRNEGQRDVVVQIQGVRVQPGDWLYADADGIVISAASLA